MAHVQVPVAAALERAQQMIPDDSTSAGVTPADAAIAAWICSTAGLCLASTRVDSLAGLEKTASITAFRHSRASSQFLNVSVISALAAVKSRASAGASKDARSRAARKRRNDASVSPLSSAMLWRLDHQAAVANVARGSARGEEPRSSVPATSDVRSACGRSWPTIVI